VVIVVANFVPCSLAVVVVESRLGYYYNYYNCWYYCYKMVILAVELVEEVHHTLEVAVAVVRTVVVLAAVGYYSYNYYCHKIDLAALAAEVLAVVDSS